MSPTGQKTHVVGKVEFIHITDGTKATCTLCLHIISLLNSYEYSGFNMNFNECDVCILLHIDA